MEVNGEPVKRLQPVLQEPGYNSCMGLGAEAALDRVMSAEIIVSSFIFVFSLRLIYTMQCSNGMLTCSMVDLNSGMAYLH